LVPFKTWWSINKKRVSTLQIFPFSFFLMFLDKLKTICFGICFCENALSHRCHCFFFYINLAHVLLNLIISLLTAGKYSKSQEEMEWSWCA
jgi:hypothetical protein